MVLARMSTWTFKNGKREEGFSELDLILSTLTRNVKGFRGSLSLISREDANSAVFLTIWNDEDSLKSSEAGVFRQATQKVERFLEGPPKVNNFRVFSAELLQQA